MSRYALLPLRGAAVSMPAAVLLSVLAGACGVPLPTSPYYLTPTSQFLVGVEFEDPDTGDLDFKQACMRFVDPEERNFYDTSPEPESGGFGGIGPDALQMTVVFDWEQEVVDLSLTAPELSADTILFEQTLTIDALTDGTPTETRSDVGFSGRIYSVYVHGDLEEEPCRSATNLE